MLRNQTAWATGTAPTNAFTSIGSRGNRGQSSTTDMTNSGSKYSMSYYRQFLLTHFTVLFAAQIQLEGVSCWDTRKPYNLNNVQVKTTEKFSTNWVTKSSFQMIQRDPVLLGFVNDLKLDQERENLWVVSNNLPIFIYGRLDYSQINFRLLRANVQRAISNTICDPQAAANPEPVNL